MDSLQWSAVASLSQALSYSLGPKMYLLMARLEPLVLADLGLLLASEAVVVGESQARLLSWEHHWNGSCHSTATLEVASAELVGFSVAPSEAQQPQFLAFQLHRDIPSLEGEDLADMPLSLPLVVLVVAFHRGEKAAVLPFLEDAPIRLCWQLEHLVWRRWLSNLEQPASSNPRWHSRSPPASLRLALPHRQFRRLVATRRTSPSG